MAKRPKPAKNSGVKELTPKQRAAEAIAWCEDNLFLPEGKFVGQQLVMAEFMKEDFRAIYGNRHKTRLAIITRGRKNAKTVECACILLMHLCGPEFKYNSQLYSIAQSRDQAAILFSLAAKMVRLSPNLRDFIDIRDTAKELSCPELGTKYKALSAEVSTSFGLGPALMIFDEAGQVRGPRSELYEAMETATGAQEEPLAVIISTQAPNDSDLLSILIDDAQQEHDPRTVLRMNTAPVELDPFSEEAIRLANPAFDIFMNKQEVLAMAENARRMPAREASYRNLVLNQRIAAETRFVAPAVWKSCDAKPLPFDKRKVYGGLDLSAVDDLTALVLMFQDKNVWQVHPTFWLPADNIHERAKTDRVPYDKWAEMSLIETIPGKSVDYEYVAQWLRGIFDRCDVQKIAFDRWNFHNLKASLLRNGFTEDKIANHFVEFGQGFQSMSPALHAFETELVNSRIAHGGHPVLTMCADNAAVVTDPQNNRKLSKQKSVQRIDGLVALAMAFGVANSEATKVPTFEMFALA